LREKERFSAQKNIKMGPSSLFYLKERKSAKKDQRSISFLRAVNLEETNKENILKSPRISCLDNEYGFMRGSPLRLSLSPKNSNQKVSLHSLKKSNSMMIESAKPLSLDFTGQAGITRLIKEIVYIEREIESAKIDLALMTDFNIGDAFRMFDVNNFGEVSKQNLTGGLKINLGFTDFHADDINRFFNKIDF
jgi:hypothetical protein